MTTLTDTATGITRRLYLPTTPEQLDREAADLKRRAYQLSYDPAADRAARAAAQELKDFRAGQRYDRNKPAAAVVPEEVAA